MFILAGFVPCFVCDYVLLFSLLLLVRCLDVGPVVVVDGSEVVLDSSRPALMF